MNSYEFRITFFGLTVLFALLAAGVAHAGFYVDTGVASSSSVNNSGPGNCSYVVGGRGYYDRGPYMLPDTTYYVIPGDNGSSDMEFAFTNFANPIIEYRALFFEGDPSGDRVKGESCPQDQMDVFPSAGAVEEANIPWSPNYNWWASDNVVQSFYKVQTYGDVGGWDATQAAL